MKESKTFSGEAVVKQHHLLVTDFRVKKEKIGKKKRTTGKIKTWALEKPEKSLHRRWRKEGDSRWISGRRVEGNEAGTAGNGKRGVQNY